MEDEKIRDEVLNGLDFSKIATHIASKPGEFADILEERAQAGLCLDLAIEHSDKLNVNEKEFGNYRAVCVRDEGRIIELSLNYIENISGYKYCE